MVEGEILYFHLYLRKMDTLTKNWKLGWNHKLTRCELVTSQTSFGHALDVIPRLCYLWTPDGQNIHSMIDSGPLRVHRTIDWGGPIQLASQHITLPWQIFGMSLLPEEMCWWNVLTTIWSFSMFWFGSCWLTQPVGDICWLPGSRVGWVESMTQQRRICQT